jgi:hypothetical protein
MRVAQNPRTLGPALDNGRATPKEAKLARKSPRGPRTVGGIVFPSLAALLRHIKAMLDGYELYQRVNDNHDAFLRDLLRHHPRGEAKLAGSPVTHFEKHPAKKGSKCFYIVREDGSLEDFGTKKCAKVCFS